jgi:hypothetical protein
MDTERPFIPGLELGRMLFQEAARGIIERVVPADGYAAALLGAGSDVLGFDAERSMDHDWGPRFQVFLPDNASAGLAAALDDELTRALPARFHGFPVFTEPSDEEPARHRIQVTTIGDLVRKHLGRDVREGMGPLDWLSFPEQRLVELTAGAVFHDPRGELGRARSLLAAYPRDAWLFRMACQWQRIAHAEAFPGRCAEAGDLIGARLAAARICRDAIRLCFLMEKTYAPYDKWLGTAFSRLRCAPKAAPLVESVLMGMEWPSIEGSLARLYEALAGMHNALGVTGPLDPLPRDHWGRPYAVIRADRFANALLRLVESPEIRRVSVRMGGLDQFVDCTDFLDSVQMYAPARRLFEETGEGRGAPGAVQA